MPTLTATYTFDDAVVYANFLAEIQTQANAVVVSHDDPNMTVTFKIPVT